MSVKWFSILSCICIFTTKFTLTMSHESWLLRDKKDNLLRFSWITTGDLHEEHQLYLKAFKDFYKNFPPAYFTSSGIIEFLEQVFALEKAEADKRYFVSVRKDELVIAFASFRKIDQNAHIKLMVIDQAYKDCGISSELVLTILNKLPDTKKIVTVIRKENKATYNFYQQLGFQECACPDKTMPEWFTCFEGDVTELTQHIQRLQTEA